jgi:hypothetical protein
MPPKSVFGGFFVAFSRKNHTMKTADLYYPILKTLVKSAGGGTPP